MITYTLFPWASGAVFGVLFWAIMLVITGLIQSDETKFTAWGCIRWIVYCMFFFSVLFTILFSIKPIN